MGDKTQIPHWVIGVAIFGAFMMLLSIGGVVFWIADDMGLMAASEFAPILLIGALLMLTSVIWIGLNWSWRLMSRLGWKAGVQQTNE